jgi:hypothetical protein
MTSLLRQHKQSVPSAQTTVRVWVVQEKESEKKGFTPLTQRKGVVHEHSQSVRIWEGVRERKGGRTHTVCSVCVSEKERGGRDSIDTLSLRAYFVNANSQYEYGARKKRKGKGKGRGLLRQHTISASIGRC